MYTVMIALALLYIIIKKIKGEKNLIIKSKIDIAMLLLVLVTFVPLVANTYYSLEDSLNYCLQYLAIYSVYILARNVIKTRKDINIIINIMLMSSVMIVVFGLDYLNYGIFRPFLRQIGLDKIDYDGMTSTFGYSNATAAYMIFMMILAFGKYLTAQKKYQKCLYSTFIQIAMIGFYYGNCRTLMITAPILILIYFICLKDSKKALQITFEIIVSYILSFMLAKIIVIYTNPILLWVEFLVILILKYIICYFLQRIWDKVNIKINKKKVSITTLTLILLFIAYILIFKNFGQPVQFTDDIQLYYDFKANQTYKLMFDYESVLNSESTKEVTIKIYEKDTARNSNLIGEFTIDKTENTQKEVEITISNIELERVMLTIENIDEQNTVTINHLYINDKEFIISHKYVPEGLIRLFRTLKPTHISISERLTFYKDSIELAKKHLILGAGGEAWANSYFSVKSYDYYSNNNHSYIFEMLVNYGLLGITIYLGLIGITLYNAIRLLKKCKGNEKRYVIFLSMLFGWLMFFIHSLIDFNLYYLLTLSIFYMFVAFLNIEDKEFEKKPFFIDNIIVVVFIITLISNGLRFYGEELNKQGSYELALKAYPYSSEIKVNIICNTQELTKIEPYVIDYIKTEKNENQALKLSILYRIASYYIQHNEIDNALYDINIICDTLINNDMTAKWDLGEISSRGIIIKNIIVTLSKIDNTEFNEEISNIMDNLTNKFVNEYDKNVEYIKNIVNQGNFNNAEDTKKIEDKYLEAYEEILNTITKTNN